MVEFRWIKISLFLMLLLHFTASVTGQYPPHSVVRDGDEVTLPCGNKIDDQNRCNNTDWIFAGSRYTAAVRLIEHGQIGENAEAKSDRLSVTEKCSLVIKKVTAEDVGQYTCRQSGHQDADVHLSLITMTEHKDDDEVMLKCSVSTYGVCGHIVKWLYEGKDVDEDIKDMKTSQSDCSVTLTFPTTHLKQKSKYHELFKCKLTDGHRKVQLFTFSPQTSGQNAGEDATTTQSISPAAPTTTRSISPAAPTTTRSISPAATTTTRSISPAAPTTTTATQEARTGCSVLDYIMLVMRVAELLLITVITVLLIRAAGNQRPPDDNTVFYSVRSRTVRRSGPAASQVNNGEDDGEVNYENFGDTSTSVRLH